VSLLPILKFYSSVDAANPIVAGMIDTLEQEGNDKVTLVNTLGPRTSTIRFEIQEGLVRVLGQPLKAALNPPPPGNLQ
jgi:hypothetical protein